MHDYSGEHVEVCVLYCDLVGFTSMSAAMSAKKLVEVLDVIYSRFDTLVQDARL